MYLCGAWVYTLYLFHDFCSLYLFIYTLCGAWVYTLVVIDMVRAMGEYAYFEHDQFANMTTDKIIGASRDLDNEIRILIRSPFSF
jgi:hypothetical protein